MRAVIKAVQADRPTELFVKVQVRVPASEAKPNRVPLNLSFVIDRSGSMSGKKLAFAKQALVDAFLQLKPEDRLSVVTFDNEVTLNLPSTRVEEVSNLDEWVRNIQSGGSTALFDGWKRGADEVASTLEKGALNRVLLLSDGQANVGKRNPEEIARYVEEKAKEGVSTTAMGIGRDFDENLMQAISDAGDGTYFFVERPEALPTFFESELNGLNVLFGTAGRLGFTPAPGCTLVDMVSDFPQDKRVDVNLWLESPETGIANPEALREGKVSPTWWALPALSPLRTITAMMRLRIAPGDEVAHLGDFYVSWIPKGDEVRYAVLGASPKMDRVTRDEFMVLLQELDRGVDASYVRSSSRRIMKEMYNDLEAGDIDAFRAKASRIHDDLVFASQSSPSPEADLEIKEVLDSLRAAESDNLPMAMKILKYSFYRSRSRD